MSMTWSIAGVGSLRGGVRTRKSGWTSLPTGKTCTTFLSLTRNISTGLPVLDVLAGTCARSFTRAKSGPEEDEEDEDAPTLRALRRDRSRPGSLWRENGHRPPLPFLAPTGLPGPRATGGPDLNGLSLANDDDEDDDEDEARVAGPAPDTAAAMAFSKNFSALAEPFFPSSSARMAARGMMCGPKLVGGCVSGQYLATHTSRVGGEGCQTDHRWPRRRRFTVYMYVPAAVGRSHHLGAALALLEDGGDGDGQFVRRLQDVGEPVHHGARARGRAAGAEQFHRPRVHLSPVGDGRVCM